MKKTKSAEVNITDIAVIPKAVGEFEVQTVNARELHEFLEVQSKFADWIQRRISDYGFIEDTDFIRFLKKEKSNDNRTLDYHISLDMAKELCMLERNAKGKEARKYFIEIEKKYKQIAKTPMTTAELLVAQAQAFLDQERKLAEIKQAQTAQQNEIEKHTEELKEIKSKVITSHSDYYTVAGYANLRGLSLDIRQANMRGRKCAKLSKEYGYHIGKVKDERFGEVNTYHLDILGEVFTAE